MFRVSLLLAVLVIVGEAARENRCLSNSLPSIFNSSICHYFGASRSLYTIAEEQCQHLGGHLLQTYDGQQDMYIAQVAIYYFQQSATSDFWFGANKLFSNDYWTWMTQEKIENYTHWSADEPGNDRARMCGAISFTGAEWSAQDCYKVKPFVCEYPMPSKK